MFSSKITHFIINAFSKNLKTPGVVNDLLTTKIRYPERGYVRFSSTIKAAVLHDFDKPLEVKEVKERKLKKGEVRIKVNYCSVNSSDLLMVQGLGRVKPNLPFTPGYEVAGEVLEEQLKDDSENPISVGDKVIALCKDNYGGFSTHCIANEKDVWRVSTTDLKKATVLADNYGLALLGLFRRGKIKEKTLVLITAGVGGLGLAAVDVAANVYKSKVIAVCSTEDKSELLRNKGAWSALTFEPKNLRTIVNDVTKNKGVDVVFETVGEEVLKEVLGCVRHEGKFIIAGCEQKRLPDIALEDILNHSSFSIIPVSLVDYRARNLAVYRQVVSDAVELFEQGLISPLISETFELEKVNEALQHLKEKKTTGKVLLSIAS